MKYIIKKQLVKIKLIGERIRAINYLEIIKKSINA
jgi:hypothetical protein